MSKRTKIWLIIAGSLLILGGILFSVAMSVYQWDFTKLSTVKYERNETEISDSFDRISIDTGAADIAFLPSENGTCKVVCDESGQEKYTISVNDRKLTIQQTEESMWYSHIGINIESPKITVYLPENAYRSVQIRASIGNVELPNWITFEEADISVTTGNVSVSGAVTKGAEIRTTTGAIRVANLSVGTLELSTTTGNITADDVSCDGDLTISVSTGNVTIQDTTCTNLKSEGSTGNMTLENVTASRKMSITRSIGKVKFEDTDAEEIFVETSTGDISGSLLSDKIFMAHSDTGHVDVPKLTSGGTCELSSDTGNIEIEIR